LRDSGLGREAAKNSRRPTDGAIARTRSATRPPTSLAADDPTNVQIAPTAFSLFGVPFVARPVKLGGQDLVEGAGSLPAAEIVAARKYPQCRPGKQAGSRPRDGCLEIEQDEIVFRLA
jgi:hypothetical protein